MTEESKKSKKQSKSGFSQSASFDSDMQFIEDSNANNANLESSKPAVKKKIKSPKSLDHLRTEWGLFWDGLKSNEDAEPDLSDPFVTGKLQSLTLEQIKDMTKALSQGRRYLNQKIELLNRDIEAHHQIIEKLKLVGGEPVEAEIKIMELNDQGQQLSTQLSLLNDRLKWARRREDELKKELQRSL